jgi:hypothetical protein
VGNTEARSGRESEGANELDAKRLHTYQRLREIADPDDIHDLLAHYGPGILDRGLPYLVVAARNRLRSRLRRGYSRYEIPTDDPPLGEPTSRAWDPLTRLVASEQLTRLLAALASMDDRDVLVVWRNVEGVADEEIRAEWDARGYQPHTPSVESIRKRRERARETLRNMIESQ